MLKPAKHTIRNVVKIRINTAMPRVATQRPERNIQVLEKNEILGKTTFQNTINRNNVKILNTKIVAYN